MQTGDLLYSVHESIKYSNLILGSAPRQGFDNFFVMSGAIYNHIVICFVVLYLAQAASGQIKKIEWTIIVPAIGFFIIHSLFNVKLDPTDPNFNSFSLYYPSIVISAFVIIFAIRILKQIQKSEQRIAVYVAAFLICFASFYFKEIIIAIIHKLPTTGGNLRYVLVVSPLLAVLAAKAIDNMQYVEKRNILWFFMIPFVCLVAGYMTYFHNWIGMSVEGDKDRIPMLLALLAVGVVLLIKSNTLLIKISAGLCVLTMLIYIHPKELCCDENFEQKKITDYIVENKLDKKPMMQSLALMDFFYGKNKWDYPAGCKAMYGDSTLDNAKVGTIVVWDTHYATKYGKVQGAYIEKNINNGKLKIIKEFKSEDQSFAAVVLEKIKM